MTPCQKKLDWPSVVFSPGNSQSISSLMSDIVMNAVTTPPQRPVLTVRECGSVSIATCKNIQFVHTHAEQ